MMNMTAVKSKIGSVSLEARNLTEAEALSFERFLRNIERSSGSFFDRPLSIGIEFLGPDRSLEAKALFGDGTNLQYNGFASPKGWELRSTKEGAMFHIPKYEDYILIDNASNSKNIDVKIYEQNRTYRILQFGAIDLLQLGTTKAIIWGSGILLDGKRTLLASDTTTGKTTILAQLIHAKTDLTLVSEDRTLIADGCAYSISTCGTLRRGALQYLGIERDGERYIDFSDHVRCMPKLDRIQAVISPQINFNGEYTIGAPAPLPNSIIMPMNRDWFCQVMQTEDIAKLVSEKSKSLAGMPNQTQHINYSLDSGRTAELVSRLLRSVVSA